MPENNKWFFSIVNHLDDKSKKEWRSRGFQFTLDDEADFDLNGDVNLNTLRRKKYAVNDEYGADIKINEFLSDLKRCVAFINYATPLFVVKDYDGVQKAPKISILYLKQFRALQDINLGKYQKMVNDKIVEKNVNAWMVYSAGNNKNYLMKDGMSFYDKRKSYLSVFTGYDWERLDKVNEDVIKDFLTHVKEVIARG